jgi:hypothetical protein
MTRASGRAAAPGESPGIAETDPPPGAAGTAGAVASALPRRSCGSAGAILPVGANHSLADPEILRRVLDGLRKL